MKLTIKSKTYILLSISFVFLLASLSLTYNNINNNSKMLRYLERDQVKLNYYVNQLNYYVKDNQAYILQHIISDKNTSNISKKNYFDKINNTVYNLNKFASTHKELLGKFSDQLKIIQKRVVAYKIVQNSIFEARNAKIDEDIQDALIGFNDITRKFSKDANILIDYANANIYENILKIDNTNRWSAKLLISSFLIAIILISFSAYKFTNLQTNLEKQLQRAIEAEKNLKQTQTKLLNYNDDLENEISKKSKELHLKIYSHFISGLPNRNKLLEDIATHTFTYLALLNIDKFQSFNDVYGEEIGNIAIKLTSDFLLKNIFEPELYVYHVGGDEFAIVCRDSKIISKHSFIAKIETILQAYKDTNFQYEDKNFSFMMSAGISFDGKQKKIIAYADMALKDAKKKNIQLSIFNNNKELEKTHQEDIEYHKIILNAIKTQNIVSFFQPIVPLQDKNKPIKYESLVRILNNGEIIAPFKFLRVAKTNRIYHKITKIVILNTFNVIKKYKIPCSLNLSLMDIEDKQTIGSFFKEIEEFDYPDLLTVELLETEDFKNYKNVYDFCAKTRTYGIKIALDDFGSGYSNFSHILHLPIDYIKIDASLISNIDRDHNSEIMVETIVSLAKRLNVETIAEFVSSKSILDIVTNIGIDYAQGFYIGKPEPIQNHIQS